jgi:hypothetical protein
MPRPAPPRPAGPSRRTFLKAGALSGAALLTGGWADALAAPLVAGGAPRNESALSLTRVAVLDDALRLWLYGFDHSAWVVGRVLNQIDVARTAALLPATPAEVADLLVVPRATYAAEAAEMANRVQPPPRTAERVAFGLGWLGFHAAAAPLGTPDAGAALARDATVVRSYAPGGADGADAEAVESLLDLLWHRALVKLHTLRPDAGDVDGWIHRYVEYADALAARHARLAEAVAGGASPGPGFLDVSDPVVAAARELRFGAADRPVPVEALLAAPGASRYARAVTAATRALQAGARYVEGEIDAPALVAHFTA